MPMILTTRGFLCWPTRCENSQTDWQCEGGGNMAFEQDRLSVADRAIRKQAKRRWHDIQAKLDERAYREHMEALDDREPANTELMVGQSDRPM